jgi:hypothetical protein
MSVTKETELKHIMPAKRKCITDEQERDSTTPKKLLKIVNTVSFFIEANNDCILLCAAYTLSFHLATIPMKLEKLLDFESMLDLLSRVPFDNDDHSTSVREALKVLRDFDPQLKFFWNYNAFYMEAWMKRNQPLVRATKNIAICYYYTTKKEKHGK